MRPRLRQVPIDVSEPMPFSHSAGHRKHGAHGRPGPDRVASRRLARHGRGKWRSGAIANRTGNRVGCGNQAQGNRHAPRARWTGHQFARSGFFRKRLGADEIQSNAAFDRIAGMLRKRDYRLRIEGHTDNTPIHNSQFPSNWELSTSRATEIVRLLIVRDGFAPDRLSAAGYRRLSSRSNQSHSGRPRHESPRGYRHSRPRHRRSGQRRQRRLQP